MNVEAYEHALDAQWRMADRIHRADLWDSVQDARSEARYTEYVTERRDKEILERLAESLTDDEYAYCIGKLGEGALERLFGVLT